MSPDSTSLTSDEDLMKAYRSESSEAAFRALYTRYEARLFRYFQKRLPRSKSETVNDLFQKTWLKIHASRHHYDPARAFSSWFFTVALNTLRDHAGSSPERTTFEELEEGTVSSDPGPSDNQEHRLFLKEDWARAETALSLLPGSQKEAFLLAEWEGLSAREIGDILGISEAAVRQLIARARSNLKAALKESNDA